MMSTISNLDMPVEQWTAGGVPITMMMNIERRNGKDEPVIRKALVELDGYPYTHGAERHRRASAARLARAVRVPPADAA